MKKFYTFSLTFILILSALNLYSQSAPQWIRDINALPDTVATTYPVRTLTDVNGDILVLSVFYKSTGPGSFENKIYLRKYNLNGSVLWTYIFNNGGIGNPRAYDMVLDNSGNCYIAGGLMTSPSFEPLLLKVTVGGNYAWQRTTTTAFSTGYLQQIFFRNSMVYVGSSSGMAKFDLNGTEQWSNAYFLQYMNVDHAGQVVFSAYVSNPNTIFRVDSNGVLNFSDSSINAQRITIGADNSFYLLNSNFPSYELVKYDSAGVFQWSYNQFPQAPPFGDIGMEMLVDYNNDLVVVGLSDTMYKFSPAGNVQWIKPMNGLDNYRLDAEIAGSNIIAVAGSIQGFGGYDMGVSFFDLNGNSNWSGVYNSGAASQEFTVDMSVNGDGVYVIEDNDQNTTLTKFESPFFNTAIDFSLVCIDSVWYDPLNPQFINVSVFNGNISHLNYPSVQIVSPITGDTISNHSNWVNFFAQLGNTYQTYTDTITIPGITDFSNYIFLVSEGLGDTTVVVNWCSLTGIQDVSPVAFSMYPNPVYNTLYIQTSIGDSYMISIYNSIGERLSSQQLVGNNLHTVDVSKLSAGIYFVKMFDGKTATTKKLVKTI